MGDLCPSGIAPRAHHWVKVLSFLFPAFAGAVMGTQPLDGTAFIGAGQSASVEPSLLRAATMLSQLPGRDQRALWMLPDGNAALAARLLLAQQAQRSLDLQ